MVKGGLSFPYFFSMLVPIKTALWPKEEAFGDIFESMSDKPAFVPPWTKEGQSCVEKNRKLKMI